MKAKMVCFLAISVVLALPASAQWTDAGTTIHTNDNVGIGTSAAQEVLHIHSENPSLLFSNSISAGWTQKGHIKFETDQNRLSILTAIGSEWSEVVRVNRSTGDVSFGPGGYNPWGLPESSFGRFLTINPDGVNLATTLQLAGSGTGASSMAFGNELVRRAVLGAIDGSDLVFWTNGSNSGYYVQERMRITSDGRVGIGRTNPAALLDVRGKTLIYNSTSFDPVNEPQFDIGVQASVLQAVNSGELNNGYVMGIHTTGYLNGAGTLRDGYGIRAISGTESTSTGVVQNAFGGYFRVLNKGAAGGAAITNGYGIYLTDVEATTGYGIYQMGTNDANYFGGSVGIGTTAPSAKLDVQGDVNVSGTLIGGNIQAKYQDLAEWVPATESLIAGTVVVLDTDETNRVKASELAYDTTVAGVVSAQPGLLLGERGEGKEMIATTGRVKVRATTANGAIAVGDLLVTSDIRGMAMRSEPLDVGGAKIHRPGTLVGKALEPLAEGHGEVLVLLSLQ